MTRIFFLVLFLVFANTGRAEDLCVIANSKRSAAKLTLEEIKKYFLKTETLWPDEKRIVPVEQDTASRAAELFNAQVLKMSRSELAEYWIGQKLSSGRTRPMRVSNDEEAFLFVSQFPDSIGYILCSAIKENSNVVTLSKAP